MQTENEISLKTCKTCKESKEITMYRPRTRECRKCTNKKDNVNRLDRNKRYYENHKKELQEKYLLSYYQNKYDDKSLSLHEVNLFRISV